MYLTLVYSVLYCIKIDLCFNKTEKMKTARLLPVLLFLLLAFSAKSADLYILYDPSCMDRLEYEPQERNNNSIFVTYHINANANEKVILEIGAESERETTYLPSQFIDCRNAQFDKRLVEDINSQMDRVTMVRRVGYKKYLLSTVKKAAFYRYDGQEISYESPEHRFTFNIDRGIVGVDIALDNRYNAEVYFEGKLDRYCTDSYIFREYLRGSRSSQTDLEIIPEIGLIEKRQGIDAADAFNNVLVLKRINDRLLPDYLEQYCTGRTPPSRPVRDTPPEYEHRWTKKGGPDIPIVSDREKGYGTSTMPLMAPPPSEDPVGYNYTARSTDAEAFSYYSDTTSAPGQPTLLTPPTASDSPCGERSGNGFHIVEKGQTLYRIAKMYNITVGQLKSWNGLSNNDIYPCDKLRVAQLTTKGGAEERQTPAGYNQSSGRLTPGAVEPGWKDDKAYHTVQRGETVAYLAMKYGFTEARFRDMNNLGSNEQPRIGQLLQVTDCPLQPSEYEPATERRLSETTERRVPDEFNYYRTPAEDRYRYKEDESLSGDFKRYGSPDSYDQENSSALYRKSNIPDTYAKGGFSAVERKKEGVGRYDDEDDKEPRPTHRVRKGETVELIARKYGISVGKLRRLNGLGLYETVEPNQKLFIKDPPSRVSEYEEDQYGDPGEYRRDDTRPQGYESYQVDRRLTHKVKEGETLQSIAWRYGLSESRLRKLNDMRPGDTVIANQTIFIK